MIVVKRGKEPGSLLEFRKQNPDADYETDMPTDVLKDIRVQMMAETARMMKKCNGKSHDAFIRELERTYTSLVQERNLTPYCGIIISWLESKLKIS